MSECNWDPSKHGGKPCPVHGAGGNSGSGGHKIRINAGKYETKLSDDSDWEEISDKEYEDLREGGYQDFDETVDDDFGFDEEDEYQEYIDKVNEDLEKVTDKKSAEYVADEIDNLTEAGYISEEMSDKLYAELDKKIDENVPGMPLYNSKLSKDEEQLKSAIKNADDEVLDDQFGKDTPERKLAGAIKESDVYKDYDLTKEMVENKLRENYDDLNRVPQNELVDAIKNEFGIRSTSDAREIAKDMISESDDDIDIDMSSEAIQEQR